MKSLAKDDKVVPIGPYVARFAIAYALLSVLVKSLLQLYQLPTNVGVELCVLVAALTTPVRKFVLDNRRSFIGGEQMRLACAALVASLLISLLQGLLAALAVVGSRQIPALVRELYLQLHGYLAIIAAVFALSCLLSLAVLYFAAGLFSRWFLRTASAGIRR